MPFHRRKMRLRKDQMAFPNIIYHLFDALSEKSPQQKSKSVDELWVYWNLDSPILIKCISKIFARPPFRISNYIDWFFLIILIVLISKNTSIWNYCEFHILARNLPPGICQIWGKFWVYHKFFRGSDHNSINHNLASHWDNNNANIPF